jgi:hypothetical protein
MRGEQEIASSPAVSLAFELRGNVACAMQYAHQGNAIRNQFVKQYVTTDRKATKPSHQSGCTLFFHFSLQEFLGGFLRLP